MIFDQDTIGFAAGTEILRIDKMAASYQRELYVDPMQLKSIRMWLDTKIKEYEGCMVQILPPKK